MDYIELVSTEMSLSKNKNDSEISDAVFKNLSNSTEHGLRKLSKLLIVDHLKEFY